MYGTVGRNPNYYAHADGSFSIDKCGRLELLYCEGPNQIIIPVEDCFDGREDIALICVTLAHSLNWITPPGKIITDEEIQRIVRNLEIAEANMSDIKFSILIV